MRMKGRERNLLETVFSSTSNEREFSEELLGICVLRDNVKMLAV